MAVGNGDHFRAAITKPFDHARLLDLARQNHSDLMLWDAFRRFCPERPLPILELAFRKSQAACLGKAAELRNVLFLFERERIPAIIFKGPALSFLAYGTLGPRRFNDLDILIPPSDRDRAFSLLLAKGYRWYVGPHTATVPGAIEADLTNGRCAVDLHWALLPRYFGKIALTPADLQPIDIGGFQAVTLRPEPLLAYLAADYARDGWPTASRAIDLARLIGASPVDWHHVWHVATQWRLHRALSLALHLAKQAGAIVPDIAKPSEPDPQIANLAASIIDRWQSGAPTLGPAEEARFHLALLDARSQRLNYVARRLFEPTQEDTSFIRLPAALRPAYYAIRPLRVAKRYLSNRGTASGAASQAAGPGTLPGHF